MSNLSAFLFLSAGLLLGVLGLLAWRLGHQALVRRRAYGAWWAQRPRRFDRNLVVIGGGAAGLVSAGVAAGLQARVTLVESGRMGGDCLNHGCVPSKTLIHHARLAHQWRQAAAQGLADAPPSIRFTEVARGIRGAMAAIEPRDSAQRYAALGVEVLQGHATLVSPWAVQIARADGSRQTLTARGIVIAAGASPVVPDIPGLREAGFLTSDTLWSFLDAADHAPGTLLVLGGGPVGCELAQALARLGSRVTLMEAGARLLPREDPEVSEWILRSLRADGVQVLLGRSALRFEPDGDRKRMVLAEDGRERSLSFDQVLCAVGRRPRLQGWGLEALGLAPRGALDPDAFLQTRMPSIWVAGDAAGSWQFTHAASHQAWSATLNALFGDFWRSRADMSLVPRVTFVDPEVAQVGLSESQARADGIPHEVERFDFADFDRAACEGGAQGFIKVLTPVGRDSILGVTIVGPHAGELIAEFCLAMRHGLGLKAILRTIHAYPTWAEASRHVAGQWTRRHIPERWLPWLRSLHAWRRGGGA